MFKQNCLTTLSQFDATVRDGQLSIVRSVCSRATCTEDRQRLERISRSKQRSYLLRMKQHRRKFEEHVSDLDKGLVSAEESAAICRKSLSSLEEAHMVQKKANADCTRLIIEYRLEFIFQKCLTVVSAKLGPLFHSKEKLEKISGSFLSPINLQTPRHPPHFYLVFFYFNSFNNYFTLRTCTLICSPY